MAASFTLVLQRALVLAAILASCVYWANLSLAFMSAARVPPSVTGLRDAVPPCPPCVCRHGVGRTTLKAFPVLCMVRLLSPSLRKLQCCSSASLCFVQAAACLLKCSEEENPYPRFSALLALGLLLGACGDVFLVMLPSGCPSVSCMCVYTVVCMCDRVVGMCNRAMAMQAVGDSYFLEGLGAFLCGHIAYITAFSVAHPPLFRLRRAVLPLLCG